MEKKTHNSSNYENKSRRGFLRLLGTGAISASLGSIIAHAAELEAPAIKNLDAKNITDTNAEVAGRLLNPGRPQPNIILMMADDQGWGDTAYNGHDRIRTPSLDQMAADGIKFNRFYSSSPVCSPTRGSSVTGRHPYRYGIYGANIGKMKTEEITLAEVLRTHGYKTGHFGKWHMGTLTTELEDGNRGAPGNSEHYSPPWLNGFDQCFATESKVPTWDPMTDPVTTNFYGTRYFTGENEFVPIDDPSLKGDDSRVIIDRAIPFIQDAVTQDKPFFTIIWFHTPHKPLVDSVEHQNLYPDDVGSAYLGSITMMDEQIGRLRNELVNLGVAQNTMLWFCSDNGPEEGIDRLSNGSAGPFRGRKRSLYEGGIRVPGILVWPDKIPVPRSVDMACSTSDYFPTVLDILGYELPPSLARPYDGESLLPLINGSMTERARPIGFHHNKNGVHWYALSDTRYKLITTDDGVTWELYDLLSDPGEENNIAASNSAIVLQMQTILNEWISSCESSDSGGDY
jgi:arylsulfatase A-like enzyme